MSVARKKTNRSVGSGMRGIISGLVMTLATLTVACGEDSSMTGLEREAGLAGKGGKGGSGGELLTGFAGALTAADQKVVVNQDNKVALDVSAASYTVASNFANTVAQYGPNLNFTQSGVPAGQPNGNCWVNLEGDLSDFDPSVTPEGIAAVLMNTLTFDGIRPRELKLVVDKRNLGRPYHNHAVRIFRGDDAGSLLDSAGELLDLSTNPVNAFQWGQNNPPSGEFLRVDLVSGNVNDASSVRVFDLSGGMVRVVGRLGPDASDPLVHLLCDVHPDDSVTATVQPVS